MMRVLHQDSLLDKAEEAGLGNTFNPNKSKNTNRKNGI
ncbi:hypothetical protein LOT_1370 [Lentilactobacillus otakiensis DSM 19908 = JCM 15040]|uniref:Uncharacterized protein n=1 Tax=Lentilactobacillus otakiensis DSM 19908 = JCM 15040 TaxID=1423780 RepID=S4NHZ9_9LACO|nr:hypothetical protein LOT_1370 [Lentilactobacillus otakiensis DSM 19908 = JCM 15040]